MARILQMLLYLCLLFPIYLPAQTVAVVQTGKPFFKNISAQEYQGHNRNFDIVCDDYGYVFVANFEGLLTYNGVSWDMQHTPNVSRITSLFKASNGDVWFGGNNVLGYVTHSDEIDIRFVASDSDPEVKFGEIKQIGELNHEIVFETTDTCYYVLHQGRIMQRGEYQLADREASSVWRDYVINDRLSLKDIDCEAMATTNHGLLFQMNGQQDPIALTSRDGLCSDNVIAIAYNGKGCLWGATDNGLFIIHVSPIYTRYTDMDGLKGQVNCICSIPGKNLYVGTLQGLYVLDSDNHFKKVEGIDLACWHLASFEDKGILAATAEGLWWFGDQTKRITSSHTLCVLPEDGQSVLTGELDGVYRCRLTGEKSLVTKLQNVVKMERDADGGVWGITLYNETYYKAPGDDRFQARPTDKMSLLFRRVDKHGDLWETPPNGRGVVCEALSDIQKKWMLPLNDYQIQDMFMLGDAAWVGGNFGLIHFNVQRMKVNKTFEPCAYIRNLSKEGSSLYFNISSDKTDPIGSIRYSYRIHDKNPWSKWSSNQNVNFSHLGFGTYEITAQVMDAFGNVAQSDTIVHTIPRPWYVRWYSLMCYVAFVALLVYAMMQWRLSRARREQMRLEQVVNERTQELRATQQQLIRQERDVTVGKLTKGLIDRILNPMNYINNFSHLSLNLASDLKANLEDEEEHISEDAFEDSMDVIDMLKGNLEKIEQHGLSTTRILKAMEELLKDTSTKMELADVAALCKQSVEKFKTYYAEDMARTNLRVDWTQPLQPVMVNVMAGPLEKVLMSILANSIYAIKKRALRDGSTYKPLIKLTLGKDADGNHIIVCHDNGIGIEESIINKVFDPFFTTKPTGEAPGVGLYLSQKVLQNMGGSIAVKSVKDEYAEFTIVLPA